MFRVWLFVFALANLLFSPHFVVIIIFESFIILYNLAYNYHLFQNIYHLMKSQGQI